MRLFWLYLEKVSVLKCPVFAQNIHYAYRSVGKRLDSGSSVKNLSPLSNLDLLQHVRDLSITALYASLGASDFSLGLVSKFYWINL